MSSLKKVRTEQAKAVYGAWVDDKAHGFDGVRFKVRGRWNSDFRALQAKLTAAAPQDLKVVNGFSSELVPSENDRILAECLIETVLLDWEGLREEEESEPIPYSKPKARELLFDPLLTPLRDSIVTASMLVAREGKEQLDDDAKNSEPP